MALYGQQKQQQHQCTTTKTARPPYNGGIGEAVLGFRCRLSARWRPQKFILTDPPSNKEQEPAAACRFRHRAMCEEMSDKLNGKESNFLKDLFCNKSNITLRKLYLWNSRSVGDPNIDGWWCTLTPAPRMDKVRSHIMILMRIFRSVKDGKVNTG